MRTFRILGLLPLLMTSLACTTLDTFSGAGGGIPAAKGPGAVFFTVEEAVLDAMAYAHGLRFPGGRPELLAGSVQRVDGGFGYDAPTAADRPSKLSTASARVRLGPDAVATYLVYSRSDDRRTDRANESLSSNARRIVDELDPEHRTLYALTPSLRVVVYDGIASRTLARLDAPRTTTVAER